MAINRTIDLLPEYFRTIPNQRFLNSTLDRLVSDPALRPFDGYVGRQQVEGNRLSGNYVTEASSFRQTYQLEPEFVFRQNNQLTKSSGFKDVLNSVAAKQGIISSWNKLLTGDAYSYQGFVDLDKLTNYYNYVWIPDPRLINNSEVDENTWFRNPVEVSNSDIPLTNRFVVTRTTNGFEVEGYAGLNPELFLARNGTYTFEITPDTAESALRAPKLIQQIGSVPAIAGPTDSGDPARLFENSYGKFSQGSGLFVDEVDDFNLRYNSFTIESWINVKSGYNVADQVIVGQWDSNDTINSSWALMRTGVANTLKFVWVDVSTGNVNSLLYSGTVSTNEWHHVAVTRSGTSLKMYIDGFLATSTTIGTIARSSKRLTVGTDTEVSSSFVGYIDDLRITTNLARYTNVTYEVPSDVQASDASTVLMINFDGEPGSSIFIDNISLENSRVWIQTHPGVAGNVPSNPSLTARSITGLDKNGISSGTITFNVPSLSDESYFRNLNVTGNNYFDFVDLATELNFNQINSAVYDTFVQVPSFNEDSDLTGKRGGIDGITDLNGKTLIFTANQDQGWENIEPFEYTGLEIDSFQETATILDSQKFGIWEIRVINGLIKLVFLTTVSKDYKVTVKNGITYRNTVWYKTEDNSEFSRMPVLVGNFTSIYLQDDQRTQNALPLTINNVDAPRLDIEKELLGKPYFTAGNGVELIDGLHIKFSSDSVPAKYTNPILYFRTKLTTIINDTETTFSLDDITPLQINVVLKIDDEQMLVTNIDQDTNSVTVSRGYKDTIPSLHNTASTVKAFKQPTYIVEGVGHEIVIVPYESLSTPEPYLDIAQDPDYITINRASSDQNPWSRTNRWFNRAVITKTLEYLTAQGVEHTGPTKIYQATRPIIEFRAGLRLWDLNQVSLAQVDVFDTRVNDALSNLNGRRISDVTALTLMDYQIQDGDLVIFSKDTSSSVRDKVYQVIFVTIDNQEPVVRLQEYAAADNRSCAVAKQGSNRGTSWNYDNENQTWSPSSQIKTSVQQSPKFDIFDYQTNSFGDKNIYPENNFTGSTLFEYRKSSAAVNDPILNFGLTYRNIANIGDITFSNTYETDQFEYQSEPGSGQVDNTPINLGVCRLTNSLTLVEENFNPWQPVNTNLELYQTIERVGERVIEVTARLLNKPNSKKLKVFVDSQQLSLDFVTVQQLGNQLRITIADSVSIKEDSAVVVKLISATPIANAVYEVPESYEINPFNRRPDSFTLSDLKLHADAIHSHHGHAVTPENTVNALNDTLHIGSPGLILLHEGFSVLPTLMLTESKFDIDHALKTAANDYELFKLKFVQASDQVEDIENIKTKQAVDEIFKILTANKNNTQPWYSSDMVPVGGNKISYVVDDVDQDFYEISNTAVRQANNQAVLVYLNDQQLTRGVDYELFTQRPAIQILIRLRANDRLDIFEVSNTDGTYVPATPTKLGLAPAFTPRIYTDTTYQEPVKVIEGHDGSITRAFNDYRDRLILDLELRIYNNIKVDNQLWSDVIQSRVPNAGKFRELNDLSLYTMQEQATIQRRFFYEWVAENRVEFRTSVYDFNNLFTYNYSGSRNKITDEFMLGYWRGVFKEFYDTDRPHTHPWEIFGYSVKPKWWESQYGPAPYSGDNLILWNDVAQGKRPDGSNPLGPRTTRLGKKTTTGNWSVLDIIPTDSSGNLLSPSDAVASTVSIQSAKTGFTFNDHGPAETAWRRSSTYQFAQLRTKLLLNPQFMLGTLWDLDLYKPRSANNGQFKIGGNFSEFKLNATIIPNINDVKLHNLDIDEQGNVYRKHSILNYVVEFLRIRGENPQQFRQAIDGADVNLVYNLAGFADKSNLSVYAEQNSPQTISQSIKVPEEDYELLLTESVPVGQVTYSGVIVTKTPNGYKVSGYDQQYPYFIINPSKVTGKSTAFTLGAQSYIVYQEFEDQPIYVPYNFEFTSRQTVVDFLVCYGENLRRQGFVFDADLENERIGWTDAAIQFVKWSLYKWSTSGNSSKLSLVLNPSASVLKFSPVLGTLENLLNHRSIILDENQQRIDGKFIDVFRDEVLTYINNQNPFGIISALRTNLVNFEHKLILKNQTVFNDLLYNPSLGIRQNRVRLVGLKTGDWNGTVASAGFLLTRAQVDEWQPNTDYLRGSSVRYKNQNYTALENVIGAPSFQQNNFTVSDSKFQDQLLPSIGAKALDLEHAYDLPYRNSISDMIRLRCNTLGYVERPWLASLGLDLLNQTEFYRGWIKEKGTLNAVNKFTSAGQEELLADFTIQEEYAVKLGEYGATGRTGFVEVLLQNQVDSNNPAAIQFVNSVNNTDRVIQVPDSLLYNKSVNWERNFVQTQGVLNSEQAPFLTAGPVLPDEIYNHAIATNPDYSIEMQNQLTFVSKRAMTESSDIVNLIKNVRRGNWFWIAVDDLSVEQNKYNVITWYNSTAKVVQLTKNQENNTLDIYLDKNINVTAGDVVAIDHNDSTISVTGVFEIADYQVAPNSVYVSVIRLRANLENLLVETVSYAAGTELQSVFVYHTLRYNDLGSADLYHRVDKFGLPVVRKAFVDKDQTGYAVYDYRVPYATGNTQAPANNETDPITFSVAQDSATQTVWYGKPTAKSGNGLITFKSFIDADLSLGETTGLTYNSAEFEIQKSNSLQLGKDLVNLTQGFAAATATTSDNRGQLYILQHTATTDRTNQIFEADGFTSANANVYYASSVCASTDGNWIVVGAPNPEADGKVLVYRKFTANSSVTPYSVTGNASLSYTLSFTPDSERSIKVFVGADIKSPTVDYTVSSNTITFANSVNGSSIVISQLGEYYDLVQAIDDPDAATDTGGQFGYSVSVNDDATVLAVGAPTRGTGKVYVFNRNIQKFYVGSTSNIISLGSNVTTFGDIVLTVNGQPRTDYAVVAGNATVTMTANIASNSIVEVDLLSFDLAQTASGGSADVCYGQSVAVKDNMIVVAAPRTANRIQNQLVNNTGRLELLALDGDVNQVVLTPQGDIAPNTDNNLRINNWVVATGANVATMITNINQLTNFTGVGARLIGGNVALTFDSTKFVNGVFNITTGASTTVSNINSQWSRIQSIDNSDLNSRELGKKLKWISESALLAVIDTYTSYVDETQLQFDINTIFDSGYTALFDGTAGPVTGERVSLLQLLRTDRNSMSSAADTAQLAKVKNIGYERVDGVDLFVDGDLNRLWIGNRLATTESDNLLIQTNTNFLQGWTLNRKQSATLDSQSIQRAWIYNSRTKEKVVDLDIVDIAQGLLPGAIAQYIDYISSVDPAVYGIPQWKSGTAYLAGERVLYGGFAYTAIQNHAAVFFNEDFWSLNTNQSAVSNSGSLRWAKDHVGQTWFVTRKLRAIDYQQGDINQRLDNFNRWFPGTQIVVCEWTASNTPPAEYSGEGTVATDAPYVLDSITNTYYFWVENSTAVGPIHSISSAAIAAGIQTPTNSGIPMIVAAKQNSVILYNVKDLIDEAENVLHIEYTLADHTNRLHSEYLLISQDGSDKWVKTPLYDKMVDSLCGIDASGLDVPDVKLSFEDRYGVNSRPRQSMFRDRVKALKIYFEELNAALKTKTITNLNTLEYIKLRQPQPDTTEYSIAVPDRDTLNVLDVNDYIQGTKILVQVDYLATNNGWSLVELIDSSWSTVTSEFYNLSTFWKSIDWQSDQYVNRDPDHEIAHIGYLESIDFVPGDYIRVLDNGNREITVYEVTSDLSLEPVFIENATIEFLPKLYDFTSAGIGWDVSGFDLVGGFDNDPATPLRKIIKALNEVILKDNLFEVAERGFFAVLRYVLQESRNVDWLFRTSFINVKHKVKNLNVKTNYRNDDEQFVLDFLEESKPYHTRIREYVNAYSALDIANTDITDFDLPALYDEEWYKAQFYGNNGSSQEGQAKFFNNNLAKVFSDGLVYIGSNGIANHPMGTWPNGTGLAAEEKKWVFAFNRFPSASPGAYPVETNGIIGLAVNGIPFYSVIAQEKDTLVWRQDTAVEETYTVNIGQATTYVGPDSANGYLTKENWYVYRRDPVLIYEKSSTQHSPIIGFALDGYPIYGPYGYKNADGTGGIVLNTSSYRLSTIPRLSRQFFSGNVTLGVVNGTAQAEYGAPTGEYIEDFEYIQGTGTLDQHNGRFVVTPEYPFGTYAYFVTVDPTTLQPAYPYVIGPSFKGRPTGLTYEYRGETVTAIYPNGNYVIPEPPPNPNTDWSLRSPTGKFPNDVNRFQSQAYKDWYDNYSYTLTDIEISNPGRGYTIPPSVTISGNATAVCTIGANGSVTGVTVTNQDNYITMPVITVDSGIEEATTWESDVAYTEGDIVAVDNIYYYAKVNVAAYDSLSFDDKESYWRDNWEIKYVDAVLTPVLTNNLTRKIQTTVKFDRINSTVTNYSNIAQYAPGETVYYNGSFYTANAKLTSIAAGTIANANIWTELTDSQIANTQASNRITALYQPTSSMISNDLTQLLYGAEFAGVHVNSVEFVDTYTVPVGKLNDVEDYNADKVSVFVQFDDQHLFENAFNYIQKIRGTRSGSFSTAEFNDNLQFGSGDSSVSFQVDSSNQPRYFTAAQSSANINLIAPGTDDFTLEFYFKMKENNREQVLLDTRDGANGGLIIAINSANRVTVSDNSATFILEGGDISTNTWHHVAVERNYNQVNLYFDGVRVDSYQDINYFTYSFNSTEMTLGASYDVDASTVANALMDELRLTVGKLRYDSDEYEYGYNGFGRNLEEDPDYIFVRLLYSFEGLTNEVSNFEINFETHGSRGVVQDISVHNRILIIENAANLTIENTPLVEPAAWNGATVYEAGDQVTSGSNYYQAVQTVTGGNIADTNEWIPVIPSNPQFEIPAGVFADSSVYLDAGSSVDYNLGVGDFAIEFWASPDDTVANKTVFELANDSATSFYKLTAAINTVSAGNNTVNVSVSTANGVVKTLTASNITAEAMFVSIERYNQTMSLFVNGVLVDADQTASYNFGYEDAAVPLIIGATASSFTGKLADFRISKVARHIPDNDFDSKISSDFSDQYLGVRAEDIRIDGTGFVNSINSGSTEEHVNGRLYDTLNIRVFTANSAISITSTAYRIFKDMLENVKFYAIPSSGTTTLTANLDVSDNEISVSSTAGFVDPSPELAQLGVVFVGPERIEYRDIDRANNRLIGLIRGTHGTPVVNQHTIGTRVEQANAAQQLPGTAGTIGVAHTVQLNTVASTTVKLESVYQIAVAMTVTGTGIVGNVTVSSIDTANNTVTLSSVQSLTKNTVLTFGDINPVLTQPFNQVSSNNLSAYRNTWYTQGSNTAADGQGLQRSTTAIAQFLTSNQALLP